MGFIHYPYQRGSKVQKREPSGLALALDLLQWSLHFSEPPFPCLQDEEVSLMIPLALNVCHILTCLPSKREEDIKDTSVAKYLPGKEEHSVSYPRRPICSSQGDCGQDHVISNLSWMLSIIFRVFPGDLKYLLQYSLPPAVSSMDSQQVLQGFLLSQRGPPSRVLSPPTYSLTYIHPCSQSRLP